MTAKIYLSPLNKGQIKDYVNLWNREELPFEGDIWQEMNHIINLDMKIEEYALEGYEIEDKIFELLSMIQEFLDLCNDTEELNVACYPVDKDFILSRCDQYSIEEIKNILKMDVGLDATRIYKNKEAYDLVDSIIEDRENKARLLTKYPFGLTVKVPFSSWASGKKWHSYKYTKEELSDAVGRWPWILTGKPEGYRVVRHRK